MRQKGQLSFDLYFAIMFAIILSQQLLVISDQFSQASNKTSILAQEKQMANSLAAILESSQALGDGSGFSIEYQLPAIFDIERRGAQSCDITISASSITIDYPNNASPATSATIQFKKPSGITISPSAIKCGDKITITNT